MKPQTVQDSRVDGSIKSQRKFHAEPWKLSLLECIGIKKVKMHALIHREILGGEQVSTKSRNQAGFQ